MLRIACLCGLLGAFAAASAGYGASGKSPVTRQRYVARVNAICHSYDRRLQRVPSPSSLSNAAEVVQALDRVLPLLRRELAETRAVEPPPGDRQAVRQALRSSQDGIAALEAMEAAAKRRDVPGVQLALARFVRARDASRLVAVALGITCG